MRNWISLFENAEGEPMTEPTVLYRSISIPELVSIAFRGAVTGGKNSFAGDHRTWVFFGDTLNDNLIGQGEDHSRYPSYALKDDPIHGEFRRVKNDIEELGTLAANVLRAAATKNGWRKVTPELLDRLEWGNESTVRQCRQDYGFSDAALKKIMDELLTAVLEKNELQNHYTNLHKDQQGKFNDVRKQWGYTSAVIITHPIEGGTIFQDEHSNHDGDEYSFYPGEVTTSDIAAVNLYQGRELKITIDPEDILATLKAAGIDTESFMQ
jgi:hypothetical protein